MRELLFPPVLIKRALDDLSAIAGAARRLESLEAEVVARMDRVEADIRAMRDGIAPLDGDMRAVRDSVDDLEPLLEQVVARLDALHADLAPLGELADKIPGVGR